MGEAGVANLLRLGANGLWYITGAGSRLVGLADKASGRLSEGELTVLRTAYNTQRANAGGIAARGEAAQRAAERLVVLGLLTLDAEGRYILTSAGVERAEREK